MTPDLQQQAEEAQLPHSSSPAECSRRAPGLFVRSLSRAEPEHGSRESQSVRERERERSGDGEEDIVSYEKEINFQSLKDQGQTIIRV